MASATTTLQADDIRANCGDVRREAAAMVVIVASEPAHHDPLLDIVAEVARIDLLAELLDRGVVDAGDFGPVNDIVKRLYRATGPIAKQYPQDAEALRVALEVLKANLDRMASAGGSGDTLDEAEAATRALTTADSLDGRANDVIEALDLISQAVEVADGSDAEQERIDKLQSDGDALVARVLDEDQGVDADTLQEIDVAHRAMHRAVRGDTEEYEA